MTASRFATPPTLMLDGVHVTNPFLKPTAIAVQRTARPGDVPWKLTELRRRAAADGDNMAD